jgi:hypothetical protein
VRIMARRADGCGEPTRIVDWHTTKASRMMPPWALQPPYVKLSGRGIKGVELRRIASVAFRFC